jgi:MoaA/NifB/PqqE/SkfB family radical SAM enzyme
LIHTNGVLCNENICRELNIIDKMHSVTFSIHAACKETYDKIVRYGNFDKVLQNLEWVSSLKKEGKIENLFMVFVVHKLNYKDMPDFVRLAENYGAMASFRYYRQWSHNTEYKYEDMAVFEESHPEYLHFVQVLQDKIFDSPNCALDSSLKRIRNSSGLVVL